MKNILSYLGSMFKGKENAASSEKLTQASKIEAAYNSLKAVGDPKSYKLGYRASDTCKVNTIAINIIEHNEILLRYIERLNDQGKLIYSDIVRTHGVRTLAEFMTQDNFYISSIEIEKFHILATLLVESQYPYKDEQTGQGAYNIRQLGNCFVSITSVCDALVACKAK